MTSAASSSPASSGGFPSYVELNAAETAAFKAVVKEQEFSKVQIVSEEAFKKMSPDEIKTHVITVKFDKKDKPIHLKIEDFLRICTRVKDLTAPANATPPRLDYPNVLRDMILDTIPTGKFSPKEAEISSKDVPVLPENRPGTRDDILNWNPPLAPAGTDKEKGIAETNLRHDLELQKSLLLKLYPEPNQKGFVEDLNDSGVSLKDQVLLLRISIHGILNPEYVPAIAGWQKSGVTLQEQVNRLQVMKAYAFGSDKWEQYLGKIVGEVPPLTDDLVQEVLFGKDAEEPNRSIMDTHVLVLVPEAVMGEDGKRQDISIESLGKLAQKPKEGSGGHSTKYRICSAGGLEKTPVGRAHWVLMRKEPLKDSGKKKYEEQQGMVATFSEKAGVTANVYDLPDAVDAIACCLLTCLSTGIRLFNYNEADWKTLVYTRTRQVIEDEYRKRYVVVGGFAPRGLFVFFNRSVFDNVRVVPARTFYGPRSLAT